MFQCFATLLLLPFTFVLDLKDFKGKKGEERKKGRRKRGKRKGERKGKKRRRNARQEKFGVGETVEGRSRSALLNLNTELISFCT